MGRLTETQGRIEVTGTRMGDGKLLFNRHRACVEDDKNVWGMIVSTITQEWECV